MSNISFDNPYLLLIIIPLLLICFIPFFIAIRKDNVNKKNVTSLVIHVIASILITLVIAHFTYEKVITKTDIYVLADVSYSSNSNLDKIDDYISDLKETSPKNSEIGVIAFAKDYELLNAPGEKIKSVKTHSCDDSATNITDALKYAGSLFSDNVIKRIVIVSDGKETNKSNIVSVVEQLEADDVYIDAIYVDNNLTKDSKEIQISQIDYNPKTFKGKEEALEVLVESSYDCNGVISLYNLDTKVFSKAIKLTKGLNVVNLDLDTKSFGINSYRVSLEGFKEDLNSHNNSYLFTQSVSNEANILFVSGIKNDKAINMMYPSSNTDGIVYKIDSKLQNENVPYTIEDLCKYDEIVLSNVDVRNIKHTTSFIKNLNLVVSEYGKSLITLGNTYIQQDDDNLLDEYSKMLPTDYGNKNHDQRILALVLDISNSLQYENRALIAKESAKAALDLLDTGDLFMIVGFHGDAQIIEPITSLTDKENIKAEIDAINLYQGTSMGAGLEAAYNALKPLDFDDKQVMLISDGLPYSTEAERALEISSKLRSENVLVHTINTNQTRGIELMEGIASAGGGISYFAKSVDDAKRLMLGEIADNYQETVIEGGYYPVKVNNSIKRDLSNNIESIRGFYYNTPKNHADIYMSTKYTSYNGKEKEAPIYTGWRYGNGNVKCLSTSLSSFWTEDWKEGSNGLSFASSIKDEILPEHKQETPFIFNVEFDGSKCNLLLSTPKFNVNDILTIDITSPSGEIITMPLAFNSEEYYASFKSEESGKYLITLKYNKGNLEYNASYTFDISYSPEYDSFELFEASSLYHMVSENGQVSEDGHLELKNDLSKVDSYLYDFTIVFMAICAGLFVVDIIIRKLTIKDIKSFFRIKRKEEGSNAKKI